MSDTIIIGMSGGVDSAVAASVLIENGYDVEAVFMKNWDENDEEFCTAAQDYKDALQVCETLDIPLRSIDLTDEYWEKVFKIFLEECKVGRTPNPDIICNKEIKFRAFLDYALELGAKQIATGHYAQIKAMITFSSYFAEKILIKTKVIFYIGLINTKSPRVFFQLVI